MQMKTRHHNPAENPQSGGMSPASGKNDNSVTETAGEPEDASQTSIKRQQIQAESSDISNDNVTPDTVPDAAPDTARSPSLNDSENPVRDAPIIQVPASSPERRWAGAALQTDTIHPPGNAVEISTHALSNTQNVTASPGDGADSQLGYGQSAAMTATKSPLATPPVQSTPPVTGAQSSMNRALDNSQQAVAAFSNGTPSNNLAEQKPVPVCVVKLDNTGMKRKSLSLTDRDYHMRYNVQDFRQQPFRNDSRHANNKYYNNSYQQQQQFQAGFQQSMPDRNYVSSFSQNASINHNYNNEQSSTVPHGKQDSFLPTNVNAGIPYQLPSYYTPVHRSQAMSPQDQAAAMIASGSIGGRQAPFNAQMDRRSKFDINPNSDFQMKKLQMLTKLSLTDVQKQVVRQVLEFYPDLPLPVVVRAAIVVRFSREDAIALLSLPQNRRVLESPLDRGSTPQLIYPTSNGFQQNQQFMPAKSARRDLHHERQTIREKYRSNIPSIRPDQFYPQQYSTTAPITSVLSQDNLPKEQRRKRLVKKLRRKRSDSFDDSYSSSDEDEVSDRRNQQHISEYNWKLLAFINSCSARDLADIASCTRSEANLILMNRPFQTIEKVEEVRDRDEPAMAKGRGKRIKTTLGSKIVETSRVMLQGYDAVDFLIRGCNELGQSIRSMVDSWQSDSANQNGNIGDSFERLEEQPKILAPDVQLKSFQLLGVNWLRLIYSKGLSGILADEMGLGKTCQVVAFLAQLLSEGRKGPHLIVVPSSTLENWLRELNRFCPSLKVEPYYGSQAERADVRQALEDNLDYNVLVTTYQLATGAKEDRKFLRKVNFDCCIYDEGHYLKNSTSDRYRHLMALSANFRLLLTGTPLQNNLRELVSLLAFILPDLFIQQIDKLDIIFKNTKFRGRSKGSAKSKSKNEDEDTDEESGKTPSSSEASVKPEEDESPLLSQQRISRAKSMMTPFVLRRRKEQVLFDFPEKYQHIEKCTMTTRQAEIYENIIMHRRKAMEARKAGEQVSEEDKGAYLMQMRQAANHPLLFRKLYTEEKLKKMARTLMQIPEHSCKGPDNEKYIFEDMCVLNDFELHNLCEKNECLEEYRLKDDFWMDSGKTQVLKRLLDDYTKSGHRMLIFSQFTMVLDILQRCLDEWQITYMRMDGQTPVPVRQDMIDQFHQETDIKCFLLSTKAGGFGINLACADVVILYDASFNPHDDRQAEDRAHRVGQTNPVQIHRLVMQDTIDIHIQELANTKLALDQSISEDTTAIRGEHIVEKLMDQQLSAKGTR